MPFVRIEKTWDITLRRPHKFKIVVTEAWFSVYDKIELFVDDIKPFPQIQVPSYTQPGGFYSFVVDGYQLEICWLWKGNAFFGTNPASILIMKDCHILAQYGSSEAVDLSNTKKTQENLELINNGISVNLLPEEYKSVARTEKIQVPDGIIFTLTRAYTIEHTIQIDWDDSNEAALELGIKNLFYSSIRRKIEKKEGNTYKQSETIEYQIQIDGKKNTNYQIVWIDIWLRGNIQSNVAPTLPFQYRKETQFEIHPLN